MFKVNNKDTSGVVLLFYCQLSVSSINFEQINVDWVLVSLGIVSKCRFLMFKAQRETSKK